MYAGASISGVVLAAPLGGALYEAEPQLLWPVCGLLGVVAGLALLAAHRLQRGEATTVEQDSLRAAAQP
jgi:hypothetical protein